MASAGGRPAAVVDEVLGLLGRSAASAYFGEPVSQLEHALQCAQLARDAGADDELVLAALLHDIGHLLDEPGAHRHAEVGVVNHDALGADWLRARGFSERLTQLVGAHVDAKRYLTATRPDYAARLSAASTATLVLQGGPMAAEEAEAFQDDPLLRDKLRLRSLDEQAKEPARAVAGLESYREPMMRHLER